jgi:hypothetical protein
MLLARAQTAVYAQTSKTRTHVVSYDRSEKSLIVELLQCVACARLRRDPDAEAVERGGREGVTQRRANAQRSAPSAPQLHRRSVRRGVDVQRPPGSWAHVRQMTSLRL